MKLGQAEIDRLKKGAAWLQGSEARGQPQGTTRSRIVSFALCTSRQTAGLENNIDIKLTISLVWKLAVSASTLMMGSVMLADQLLRDRMQVPQLLTFAEQVIESE